MDVPTLIEALSRPEAYPHPVDTVEVHQTHVSVVFLAGPYAYKIKKPVNLGFLDFSTLEKRKHFCDEEMRLNRRLAPHVYLGVVPITSEPEASAKLRVESLAYASGSVVEWAVHMQRLPAEATLERRLLRDEVTREQIGAIARRIAKFHRQAARGPTISASGRFDVVAKNARDNFTQAEPLVGATVSPIVFERLRHLTEEHLERLRDVIESRASRGVPCETHGDLHLDHVYLFPDEPAPRDLVIIDCIEFAERYRHADPVADMAFLAMDLSFHGRRDLAREFAQSYVTAANDAEGRALLPFYTAYRAIVRAKVEGMELCEQEIEPDERRHADQRAKAHWLLALGELEQPDNKPALVVLAGLPGSGKSTLARHLADQRHFQLLRSDVIRKELASLHSPSGRGVGGEGNPRTLFSTGIYSPEWTERTYAEMLQRAEQYLWQGNRVLIDANFRDDLQRRRFFDLALRWGVTFLFVHCTAEPDVGRSRLAGRKNDASDADWRVYQQLVESWQPISGRLERSVRPLDTSGPLQESIRRLHAMLEAEGLL